MDSKIKEAAEKAVKQIVEAMVLPKNLDDLDKNHDNKIHFVPKPYRVLGGTLQSLNIKFGNIIEVIIEEAIKQDNDIDLIEIGNNNDTSVSRLRKTIEFELPDATSAEIEKYINARKAAKKQVSEAEFKDILDKIVQTEQSHNREETNTAKYDVDILFQKKADGKYTYLEVKTSDNHDSDKSVSINRKLLTTYAGIVQNLQIESSQELQPMLYFFNGGKKVSYYLPSNNRCSGDELFKKFFQNFSYEDLKTCLTEISKDPEVIVSFDKMYKTIRERTSEQPKRTRKIGRRS